MTCIELLHELIASADPKIASRFIGEDGSITTSDRIVYGDPNRMVSKVAVTMFPTHDVIIEAAQYGADAMIVHEPIFYGKSFSDCMDKVSDMKEALIRETGITILRFHDYAHARTPDLVFDGVMHLLDLKGKVVSRDYAHTSFVLDTPITARDLAKIAEEKLHTKHVRIAGSPDQPGTRISCSFGQAGGVVQELEHNDFYICGEITEWRDGEYARDYAQFGYNKALIVLTHEVSERAGMQLLTDQLSHTHPDVDFRYFESNELYSYVD